MVGRKVVEEDAAVSIIGIEEILEAQVKVVDEMLVREEAVVAKGRAVGELEIIKSAAQRSLASEEGQVPEQIITYDIEVDLFGRCRADIRLLIDESECY